MVEEHDTALSGSAHTLHPEAGLPGVGVGCNVQALHIAVQALLRQLDFHAQELASDLTPR